MTLGTAARSTLRRPARWLRRTARRSLGATRLFVSCPVCGHRDVRFERHGMGAGKKRPNARCPRCRSLERHRLLVAVLRSRGLSTRHSRLLHFAPEAFLLEALGREAEQYVTFDIGPKDVRVRGDITALPFPDATFDVVVCVHVLEHVRDDTQAMRELRRVLAPRGWALVDVPQDLGVTTQEDPDADVETRIRLYGQADHVRLYGKDFADRLRAAGFQVERVTAAEVLGASRARRLAVPAQTPLHLCRVPG